MGTSPCFEVSVDAHTKGRELDSYRQHRVGEGLRILVDSDLHRLPMEVLVVTGGLFGRSLDARIDGGDGAPCPFTFCAETRASIHDG